MVFHTYMANVDHKKDHIKDHVWLYVGGHIWAYKDLQDLQYFFLKYRKNILYLSYVKLVLIEH